MTPHLTVLIIEPDASRRTRLYIAVTEADFAVQCWKTAADFLDAYEPDIGGCIVFDMATPGMPALQLIEHLRKNGDFRPIILLAADATAASRIEGMNLEHVCVTTNPFKKEVLLRMVGVAIAEERQRRGSNTDSDGAPILPDSLTTREREIIRLVISGKSSRQIAEALFLSERTVENHRSHIMRKLKVHKTTDLMRLVLNGFSTPPPK